MERIDPQATNPEIMRELGGRLREYRLSQNQSIERVARRAGIGKLTLLKAEHGGNCTLRTLVRVLRALGRLDQLDQFLPSVTPSPMALLARGTSRRRAGRRRHG